MVGRDWSSPGPLFLKKLLKMVGEGMSFLEWEERTSVQEEESRARRNGGGNKRKGLALDQDALQDGALRLFSPSDEEPEQQSYSPHKAQAKLEFSAKAFAEAGLGSLEVRMVLTLVAMLLSLYCTFLQGVE